MNMLVTSQYQEEFEDTKGVIRIHISKVKRQHKCQKKKAQKDKQRSTKHTYKTKDQVTRTPLKTGGELRCSGRVGNSWFSNITNVAPGGSSNQYSHQIKLFSYNNYRNIYTHCLKLAGLLNNCCH